MRRIGEKDYCLTVENQNNMKKLFLILFTLLAFACCSSRLTEKVEARYPNEQPQYVRKYDKSGDCVYETEYYETGQVRMEGAMKNGKRQGEWNAYLRDGRPWSIDVFKDGVLEGPSTVYWENGNLRWEGYYKAGKHCGEWKWYDEQGNLLRVEQYPE